MRVMWYLAASITVAVGGLGVLLTAATLPGTWLIALWSVFATAVWPEHFSWWVVATCVGLALAGEVVEFSSSAVGAGKFGASKSGMTGAVIGSIAGAIGGTILIPIPVIGTLTGAVLGAGLGTGLAERGVMGRGWRESGSAAVGAAGGRLVAVIVKTALAGVMALAAAVDAFVD